MLNFYFPDIRAVVAKPNILRYVIDDIEAGDWFVHMCFSGKYFAQFEATCKTKAINYLRWMSKWFCMEVHEVAKPSRSQLNIAFDSASKKLTDKQIKALSDGRFVILALQSFSCNEMPEKLSADLVKKLKSKNYEIYDNSKFLKTDLCLTYPEIYAIAQRSAYLYAQRSGLVDFLSNSGVPLYIYYCEFKDRGFNTPHRSAEEVLELFSVSKLPLENAINATEKIISNKH